MSSRVIGALIGIWSYLQRYRNELCVEGQTKNVLRYAFKRAWLNVLRRNKDDLHPDHREQLERQNSAREVYQKETVTYSGETIHPPTISHGPKE
jgi:hypothetical protein